MTDPRRHLPAMHEILQDSRLEQLPRDLCKQVGREILDEVRQSLGASDQDTAPDVVALVRDRVTWLLEGRARPVLNATGVVLHTNLGRAPWPHAARQAALAAMAYGNVEIDLATGRRGGRLDGIAALARVLTGAESAIVVNNCAAAVLLALTAHARDREVLVSRGELVEIGGSFRVPDVIASGGARLVDVGTTNRTRRSDYAEAIGEDTAVLLKVHRSNFRIEGFTSEPSIAALAALAREHGVRCVYDLGSGSLDGWGVEPSVREAIAAGVDLAIFSGDKLLGGPQAGLILGSAEAVAACRRHPLYRALRVDKVTLAALEATLALHATGVRPPALAMLEADLVTLEARAVRLSTGLRERGLSSTVTSGESRAGGGSLPGEGLPSRVVVLEHDDVEALHRRLRLGAPSVVARVHQGRLVLDVRTLSDDELVPVADALRAAWQAKDRVAIDPAQG